MNLADVENPPVSDIVSVAPTGPDAAGSGLARNQRPRCAILRKKP
jgi:hypothetical protein